MVALECIEDKSRGSAWFIQDMNRCKENVSEEMCYPAWKWYSIVVPVLFEEGRRDERLVFGDGGRVSLLEVGKGITSCCFCIEMSWAAGGHDSLEDLYSCWVDVWTQFREDSVHIAVTTEIFAAKVTDCR